MAAPSSAAAAPTTVDQSTSITMKPAKDMKEYSDTAEDENVILSEEERSNIRVVAILTKPIAIRVFANGDPYKHATYVTLKPAELRAMRHVIRVISERVKLPAAKPITKLYSLNGKLVEHASALENGFAYVAAGSERFKAGNYGSILPPLIG